MLKNAIALFTLTVLVLIFFLPSFTMMQEKRQRNAEYDEQVKRLERKKLKMMRITTCSLRISYWQTRFLGKTLVCVGGRTMSKRR